MSNASFCVYIRLVLSELTQDIVTIQEAIADTEQNIEMLKVLMFIYFSILFHVYIKVNLRT